MINTRPKISLIACFYNVEDCVEYCVNSIVAQTYKDVEVILVDDGSTDNTGRLLDSLVLDRGFTVLHGPNEGLSGARNKGIQWASGEYITIVDGDDIISRYYLESLVECLLETTADLVVGGSKAISAKRIEGVQSWKRPNKVELLSKREAAEQFLYEHITESSCAKLIKRELYIDCPFPKGRVYEEVATTGNYLLDAENIAVLDGFIYGYVMRQNSIVHKKRASIKQALDFKLAIHQLLGEVRTQYPEFVEPLAFRECLLLSRLHRLLVTVTDKPEEARTMDAEAICRIRELYPIVENDPKVSKAQKLRFKLLVTSPKAYGVAMDAYERLFKGIG